MDSEVDRLFTTNGLRKNENTPRMALTKPTKPSCVSFVSSDLTIFSKNLFLIEGE
jgi:hypothetical protein